MSEEAYQKNEKLILKFIEHMKSSGLNIKTIKTHTSNIELLNDYLGDSDQAEFVDADHYEIECFIRWCIDKWMFNTVNSLVLSLSSIKQFYDFLQQNGLIKDAEKIGELCSDRDKWAKEFSKHDRLLGDS